MLAILAIFIYFIPAIVAYHRKTVNKNSVLVLNVFLGWTFIGWVIALMMACSEKREIKA